MVLKLLFLTLAATAMMGPMANAQQQTINCAVCNNNLTGGIGLPDNSITLLSGQGEVGGNLQCSYTVTPNLPFIPSFNITCVYSNTDSGALVNGSDTLCPPNPVPVVQETGSTCTPSVPISTRPLHGRAWQELGRFLEGIQILWN
ncbi:hypothetical protein GG344DRAFT_67802 [Lentinula edodes]|nr:hypothetical protein GG344DRAFT_67802 [Lentinula edodes]